MSYGQQGYIYKGIWTSGESCRDAARAAAGAAARLLRRRGRPLDDVGLAAQQGARRRRPGRREDRREAVDANQWVEDARWDVAGPTSARFQRDKISSAAASANNIRFH